MLNRESTHPRDDVATLLQRTDLIERSGDELRLHLRNADEDLRRTESALVPVESRRLALQEYTLDHA